MNPKPFEFDQLFVSDVFLPYKTVFREEIGENKDANEPPAEFRDGKVSKKTIFVYTTVMAQFKDNQLITHLGVRSRLRNKMGRDRIVKCFQEIQAMGFAKVTRRRDPERPGKILGHQWFFYDTKQDPQPKMPNYALLH